MQLYVDRQRAKSEALVRKVEALGRLKAVFVTVDAAAPGKREADERGRAEIEVVRSCPPCRYNRKANSPLRAVVGDLGRKDPVGRERRRDRSFRWRLYRSDVELE